MRDRLGELLRELVHGKVHLEVIEEPEPLSLEVLAHRLGVDSEDDAKEAARPEADRPATTTDAD